MADSNSKPRGEGGNVYQFPAVAEAGAAERGLAKTAKIVSAAVHIIENQPAKDDLAWGARCLVAAALPYRNPKPEQLQNGAWVRRNGNYTLWIQGGPAGLPYGSYPRMFMIWLTSEAIRAQSRRIETGSSFWDFCRKVQIDTSRGKNGAGRRFAEQVNKLLSSRAAFVTGSFDDRRLTTEFLHFTDRYQLFFDAGTSSQGNLFESEIVLTEAFYNEITTHCIPLDIRAVVALRQAPLELDIYQWLAYRMYSLHKSRQNAYVSKEQLRGQFGTEAKRMVDFWRDFKQALHAVKQVYDGANIELTDTGLVLLPSPPPIPDKLL